MHELLAVRRHGPHHGHGREDILPEELARAAQTRWSYGSRQLAVAGRSLDMVEPNPIHGQLLALV